jgi:DNA-binding MarR family transcriptional regulator
MHTGNVVVAWATAVHDRLRQTMRDLRLESRELSALTLIAHHDGCSGDWLRTRIDLTQSGTVRLLDRLAGRGLIRRDRSTGRGVPLHVTAAGLAALDEWARARDGLVDDLVAAMPERDREAVLDGMARALLAHPRERAQADATCRRCTWTACGSDCPVDRSVPDDTAGR